MVLTCYSDIWETFVPMCLCWHEECFPIVQLNRHSSCMRDFCIVRSRDVQSVNGTRERFSSNGGEWNIGIFPGVFFVTVSVTVLYVIDLLVRRRVQVPVTNIDIFALYGLVMNPTPPWSLRDVASETLFDMIFLKCSWRALLHLFCVVSWWLYHHDSCRSHSWCFLFREGVPAIFYCKCFTVWFLDTYLPPWHLKDSFPEVMLGMWHLLGVVVCAKGPSDDLCYIRTVWFLWWTPHHHDPRGSRWQMMIGIVEAIHVPFQWRSHSSSLCWAQFSLFCVFMWWTPHHHNLWGRRSSKRLAWHREIFCWSSSFRLRCLVPWWTPFHQDVKRIVAHKFGWHGVFLLAKRSQRWSVLYLHSVVLWHTLSTMTLAGRFVPKSNLPWLLCFINLDCVVQQSFVLCSQCVDMRRTSHHHDRVALSKKFGNTWR